jgi:hypothetical protein
MRDVVFDANVVRFANGNISGRQTGNALDTRLGVLEDCIHDRTRGRYNPKLWGEYAPAFDDPRNDIVVALIIALSDRGVRVPSNTLSRQLYAKMRDARWPSHDQHLLAAAIDGNRTVVYSCERNRHGPCARAVRREFGVGVCIL